MAMQNPRARANSSSRAGTPGRPTFAEPKEVAEGPVSPPALSLPTDEENTGASVVVSPPTPINLEQSGETPPPPDETTSSPPPAASPSPSSTSPPPATKEDETIAQQSSLSRTPSADAPNRVRGPRIAARGPRAPPGGSASPALASASPRLSQVPSATRVPLSTGAVAANPRDYAPRGKRGGKVSAGAFGPKRDNLTTRTMGSESEDETVGNK